ncbi:MAG TPA: aspartyl/asparaginyl beta-hydroxylase domain-containing protein [Vicinamibacterales bacterium]|nr:aspartyl/asparaginyl beta-hydroxylase domain-containing protein [Vicinamibacterales bacterium]
MFLVTALRERFLDVSIWFLHRLDVLIAWSTLVGDPVVFDQRVFPWAQHLESNWLAMRVELEQVLKKPNPAPPFQYVTPDLQSLTDDDGWKSYFFYISGHPVQSSCQECPTTAMLLRTIPGMASAFFSILAPGKHLPPHRGVTKAFVRYHLPLIVPEPAGSCRIRLDTDTYYWKEGESFIFDDTREHEVWNDSDALRVVLFVDVLRPMRFPGNAIIRAILWVFDRSPWVGGVVSNYQQWEQKMAGYSLERETRSRSSLI